MLRSRLYEQELEKRRAETAELEASKQDISFGSQIRNYVLAPYRLVKDARTKLGLDQACPNWIACRNVASALGTFKASRDASFHHEAPINRGASCSVPFSKTSIRHCLLPH
jgi:hypothetical protein